MPSLEMLVILGSFSINLKKFVLDIDDKLDALDAVDGLSVKKLS